MSVDDVFSVTGLLTGLGIAGLAAAAWWFGAAKVAAFFQGLFDRLVAVVSIGAFVGGSFQVASIIFAPGLSDLSQVPQSTLTAPTRVLPVPTTPLSPLDSVAVPDAPAAAPVPVMVRPEAVEPAAPVQRAEPAAVRPRIQPQPREAAARPSAERRTPPPVVDRDRPAADRLFVGTIY